MADQSEAPDGVPFTLNGRPVVARSGGSLLDTLREQFNLRSVKDGCSPQGQCGCCTVWVNGQPRVSCVTPVARVKNRDITTIEGLDDAHGWAEQFAACGAAQCGFCTPGIVMRAAALSEEKRVDPATVCKALLAHQCRCTGWHPIVDAITRGPSGGHAGNNVAAAEQRAAIEGRTPQRVGPDVALGAGGFADDIPPHDALVAVRDVDGGWVVAETLDEARAKSGKVQGRRTTAPLTWPVAVPDGDWAYTLQTTWVEPAYLEPDASWCKPGGVPMSPHGNGGAFGGKTAAEVAEVARQLADQHGRAVRVLSTREDVVRYSPKRPPLALGIAADGTGAVTVAATPGVAEAICAIAPDWTVREVTVDGSATSASVRAAGWAEVAAARAAVSGGPVHTVIGPEGGRASVRFRDDGSIAVRVWAGTPLDERVLRSYCIGAAHMGYSWVMSEGLSVGDDGQPLDLTMRSFGVLRAGDTPDVTVEIDSTPAGEPVNVSDAVFAAVAGATWARSAMSTTWPIKG